MNAETEQPVEPAKRKYTKPTVEQVREAVLELYLAGFKIERPKARFQYNSSYGKPTGYVEQPFEARFPRGLLTQDIADYLGCSDGHAKKMLDAADGINCKPAYSAGARGMTPTRWMPHSDLILERFALAYALGKAEVTPERTAPELHTLDHKPGTCGKGIFPCRREPGHPGFCHSHQEENTQAAGPEGGSAQ